VGNVGNEGGTYRDDGECRVKQERENGFVLEKSNANGTDDGCGREKMVSGGEKMVDVVERRWRAAGRRR